MSPNPATLHASTLVNALAAAGLRHACIAPGSRSTPLTLAFHAHPEIELHLQLDERSAGYMALGLAMKTGRPAVLVCTSGTAAANFYPAVIEANMSQVPLIVLTADRPPELRHSGANQTIDQVKMYGDHVLWAVDLDPPTAGAPTVARRNVATTATRAFQIATGLRRGPVHINIPFRKPLEPDHRLQTSDFREVKPERGSTAPPTNSALGTQDSEPRTQHSALLMPSRTHIATLTDLINRNTNGLIVCGPGCPSGDFSTAVVNLARTAGYVIAADPLSGLRYGPWVDDAPLWTSYETTLAGGRMPAGEPPQVIIRFGAVPTSKWLNQYLDGLDPDVRLHVRASGVWADDSHRTTDFWPVDETALCQMVSSLIVPRVERQQGSDHRRQNTAIMRAEPLAWQAIEAALGEVNYDAAVVFCLLDLLPEGSNLMIGNSLPIRHVDQFARPSTRRLHLFGNRGASGIDGVVSTAVGLAKADPDHLTVLLIGDISFFHDQNGLLPVRRLPNLKIVLLNNNGGSIFRRLPVAALEPPFTELFLTPHDLDFRPVIEMHGLFYQLAADPAAFRAAFSRALTHPGPAVVEFQSDGKKDEGARKALVGKVNGEIGK